MAKQYKSVVCTAYVVPTIPCLDGAIGDPDGPGFVTGQYTGLDDSKADIAARFGLAEVAARQAWDLASDTRDDPTVLHIFCFPEFFFRGKQGAYPSGKEHELRHILGELVRKLANEPKFAHWVFLAGTMLESDASFSSPEMQQKASLRNDLAQAIARAYKQAQDDETKDFVFGLLTQMTDFAQSRPLCKVRNQCYIYKQNWEEWPKGVCVNKRFVSHEDFVASYYAPGVYSEESVAYPFIDESNGEIKKVANDSKGIFKLGGINLAVEICLDHRRSRLRRVRNEHEESRLPIDIQLVVSCGMQLQQPSIVARSGGVVFNCDGQYAKRDTGASPDDKTSIFVGSADQKGHSQLCTVIKEAGWTDGEDAEVEVPHGLGFVTAPLQPPYDISVDQIEAYGAGEVHVYTKVMLP